MKALGTVLAVTLALAVAAPALAATKVTGVVNLNTATAAQLDELPGVGEKAAGRIVAYRQKTPFKRVEELVKVKGFGKKKFEKLKQHLTLNGPTTIHSEGSAQARRPSAGH
jgi:competence protein ComEA